MPAKKKTEAAPVAEVKKEAAAEAKTEAAAPAEAPKPVEKKPAKKAPAKKAPAKKTEPKTTVKVQFAGNEYDIAEITKKVTKASKASVKGTVKKVEIYIKPEEGVAYYVVNSDVSDKIDL